MNFSMTAVDIWDKLWGIALGGGIRWFKIKSKDSHHTLTLNPLSEETSGALINQVFEPRETIQVPNVDHIPFIKPRGDTTVLWRLHLLRSHWLPYPCLLGGRLSFYNTRYLTGTSYIEMIMIYSNLGPRLFPPYLPSSSLVISLRF